MSNYISIDIGGTSTRVAVIGESNKIISKKSFPTDPNDVNTTIEKIVITINEYKEEVIAIGLSCQGPLNMTDGIILDPPNLQDWHGYPIKDKLESMTGLSVYIENDANLAALAEAKVGHRSNINLIQYLTVSTGVGGGLIYNGEIFTGHNRHAQELANMILRPNGFALPGLDQGSLESLCSGTGIVGRANDNGLSFSHAGEVFKAAEEGNQVCIDIVEESYEIMANMVSLLYAVIDPGLVIIGGGLANKVPGYIDNVAERVKRKVYPTIKQYVKIESAHYNDDSGLIGAAIYARMNQ